MGNIIQRGTVLSQFIGANGMMWDMSEDGAILIIIAPLKDFNKYKLGGHYDFSCTKIGDVMFFSVNISNAGWTDAPYTPHLSSHFNPKKYPKGMGMPLFVYFVASETGEVINLDFLTLGNSFSNEITKQVSEILKHDFNQSEYSNTISDVYNKMTSDQLVKASTIHYSID